MPIPGTTKLHRLEENLGAANVDLTSDDIAEIEHAASAITVEGERYPADLLRNDRPPSESVPNGNSASSTCGIIGISSAATTA